MIVVRHVPTADNSQAAEGGEKIRGWRDLPPTTEGKAQAHRVADFMKIVAVSKRNWTIFSSPLIRATYQAKALARALNSGPVKEDKRLLPWNLGELQGQIVDKVKPQMISYMKNPSQQVPGGESFDTFVKRFKSFFDEHAENHDAIVVTHLRDILLSKSLAEKGKIDPSIMDDFKTVGEYIIMKVGPEGFQVLL